MSFYSNTGKMLFRLLCSKHDGLPLFILETDKPVSFNLILEGANDLIKSFKASILTDAGAKFGVMQSRHPCRPRSKIPRQGKSKQVKKKSGRIVRD